MTKLHSSKITRSRTKFHQVQELGGSQQLQDLTGKVEVVKLTVNDISTKIGNSGDDKEGNSLFSKIAKVSNLRIELDTGGGGDIGTGSVMQVDNPPRETKKKS